MLLTLIMRNYELHFVYASLTYNIHFKTVVKHSKSFEEKKFMSSSF